MASTKENIWKNILKVVLIGIVITASQSKRFHSIAGPFKIAIKRAEHCSERGDAIFYTLKDVSSRETHKIGPTYNINASINTFLDDNLTLRVLVGSWSNMGGWKDNAHIIIIRNACSSLSRWGDKLWIAFWKSVAGEMWPCPYIPGLYRYENFTLVLHDIPIKQFFYGRWRVDFQLLHRNQTLAFCFRTYMDTLPR